ncbi:MAG TPA: cell division protein SepF [Nanoarchaeota archaeon]|nr:cell division protein SepF [Nanoarchaeota archaeon]
MKRIVNWVKEKVRIPSANSGEFIEMEHAKAEPKVSIKTYQLTCFDDTKRIVSELREGRTIMLIDVSPIKEKDIIDLKRSVNKLKTATAEMGGEIAGLGGDWLLIAPMFAEIWKQKAVPVEMKDVE